MFRVSLAASLILSLAVSVAAQQRMELGTNFWNIGWHSPSDCFANWKDVRGDAPWNPQFLREISIYRFMRFMDWDQTNNSARRTWRERNHKNNPQQNPVAYEWMIDLCNRSNADMWVTIPHQTITRQTGDTPCDYALRLCILVKTGVDMKDVDLMPLLERLRTLSPRELIAAGGEKTCEPLKADLRLYVEYSNETWNGGFKQSHYCCDEGLALGLDKNRWTAGFRYHAWAAIRLFRAADLVFGADSTRVVRVLATQSANAWIAGQHLQVMADRKLNPWAVKADAIAIAPYFGHSVDGADPDVVAKLRAAIQKSAQEAQKRRKLADEAHLRLIAYEGGQHVLKNADQINRSPAMHDLYAEYLAAIAPFISQFCHYCHVGQAGKGGAWGCIEATGRPPEQSPKYRALKEYAQGH